VTADTKNFLAELPAQGGHTNRVVLIKHSHRVHGLLASSSTDKQVKLWDLSAKKPVRSYTLSDYAVTLEFSHDSNLLGCISFDKKLNILDARADKPVAVTRSHAGSGVQKYIWLGNLNFALSNGFDGNMKRQQYLWDLRRWD
jgi:WD40 repeat protein